MACTTLATISYQKIAHDQDSTMTTYICKYKSFIYRHLVYANFVRTPSPTCHVMFYFVQKRISFYQFRKAILATPYKVGGKEAMILLKPIVKVNDKQKMFPLKRAKEMNLYSSKVVVNNQGGEKCQIILQFTNPKTRKQLQSFRNANCKNPKYICVGILSYSCFTNVTEFDQIEAMIC